MSVSHPDRRRLLASERYLETFAGAAGARRAAVVFPNTYAVGMSSLAVHTLWRLLAEAGWEVDRVFLDPQLGRSLEHGARLRDFDLLVFTCAYELDYLNLAPLLEAGGIAPLREQRGGHGPLLCAGGPGVTQNPEPLAPLFDLLFVGEVEPVWAELAAALALVAHSKRAALEAAAPVPGVYRPDQPPSAPLIRQVLREVDRSPTASVAVTPEAELSDMFLVEIGRGCPQTCRFCLARQIYHPFRPRSLAGLLTTIRPALAVTKRVGLLGAALSDHPHLLELCETLAAEGAHLSTSSLRVDALTPRLAQVLAAGGARTLTLAPETGNETLRRAIGKPIRQAQILAAAQAAAAAGLGTLKLYFMLGLPEETAEDRASLAELVADLRQAAPGLRLEVALSPLVPKPHTPWADREVLAVPELRRRAAEVRKALGRLGITAHFGSPRGALVQTALSRGGQELGPVIVEAGREGGSLPAVREVCRRHGLRLEDYARAPREQPWRIVSV